MTRTTLTNRLCSQQVKSELSRRERDLENFWKDILQECDIVRKLITHNSIV